MTPLTRSGGFTLSLRGRSLLLNPISFLLRYFRKSVSIRSRQPEMGDGRCGCLYICCHVVAHLQWGGDILRPLSPQLVNPIILYCGNPSDSTNGLAGNLRRRWRRVWSETSICSRSDASWSRQRSAATPPTDLARDAFRPLSRARTHARTHTHHSQCIRGASDTPSGVDHTYCTCVWACTCSMSTSPDTC